MTPSEFKSWFEGFTEAMDRLPTKGQWARIKERVAEIDGKPVTERIFVDRYYPHWITYYPHSLTAASVTSSTAQPSMYATGSVFSSNTAMYSLGQIEATATN
jgi:hypothetical protein